MDEFDNIDFEAAELAAEKVAERKPEFDADEADCEGCKI